jgi:hypothetical protein
VTAVTLGTAMHRRAPPFYAHVGDVAAQMVLVEREHVEHVSCEFAAGSERPGEADAGNGADPGGEERPLDRRCRLEEVWVARGCPICTLRTSSDPAVG